MRDLLGPRPRLQLAILLVALGLVWLVSSTILANMARLGLTPGFGFLGRPANFEIGESPVAFRAGAPYARALLAGLVNTVLVSALACLLATVLGALIGLARMSRNLLLSRLAQTFIEFARNTPLLLQLFFWTATAHALPAARQALQPVSGVYLSNRGVYLPWVSFDHAGGAVFALAVLAAIVLALAALFKPSRRRRLLVLAGAATAVAAGLSWLVGSGVSFDLPTLRGFNFTGGFGVSPEFAALVVGLTVHGSAQVAEIVRAGVQSVPAGQWEAAEALGMSRAKALRLVVAPQALRVIVPLMTSTYLDITKNSSLAVAIGFTDFVSVANTTANQSGHAVEALALMIAAYLALSLSVSVVMNRYDAMLERRGFARP
ncbi:ABC transporter permease subunit [Methylopila sp. M107]|uniref:amino acid ABC transporter permease n=1 Tax=Methylopila sp. M107 TaxID=1101190 RepID=UPI0003774622|nr:ABC transporter permease subunit [Methylopila sp. M107]